MELFLQNNFKIIIFLAAQLTEKIVM